MTFQGAFELSAGEHLAHVVRAQRRMKQQRPLAIVIAGLLSLTIAAAAGIWLVRRAVGLWSQVTASAYISTNGPPLATAKKAWTARAEGGSLGHTELWLEDVELWSSQASQSVQGEVLVYSRDPLVVSALERADSERRLSKPRFGYYPVYPAPSITLVHVDASGSVSKTQRTEMLFLRVKMKE